jgi:hypothetical protein
MDEIVWAWRKPGIIVFEAVGDICGLEPSMLFFLLQVDGIQRTLFMGDGGGG